MCIPFHIAFFFLLIRFINSFISCSPLSDHLRDLVSRLLPEEKSKVSLIVDGCSPVAGYEAAAQECIEDMAAEGVIPKARKNGFSEMSFDRSSNCRMASSVFWPSG